MPGTPLHSITAFYMEVEMKMNNTHWKLKLLLLLGRPIAFVGIGLVFYGILIQNPKILGTGISLIGTGFVAGWSGKIGLFFSS